MTTAILDTEQSTTGANVSDSHHPLIIQGGMGAAVSDWRLARAVASRGALGVVSGTGIDQVLARRLQEGDREGVIREALAAFPCRKTAERTLTRFFLPDGKPAEKAYKTPPMFRLDSPAEHQALGVLAAFTEVWLAKKGHDGMVGINLLEKIALPNPSLLFGAILAGVDYVLMGAGIPWQIPGILDSLARREAVSMRLPVEGDKSGDGVSLDFDPSKIMDSGSEPLRRPAFLAIVSSPVIAQTLLKRATGSIEGFVVEGNIAGGHNAPPRGPLKLNDKGEPIYGERDAIDLTKFKALDRPFWLAGGQGHPDALGKAITLGAAGIQVGSLFAFCRESGLDDDLRRRTLASGKAARISIYTDPLASPTGFPFKVVELDGTLAEDDLYLERERVCDAGYLRRICRLPDGQIGYRCPGEPLESYLAKGGEAADVEGRKCLCNALLANIGLPQVRRNGAQELPLLTAGDELADIADVMGDRFTDYGAADVLEMLGGMRDSSGRSVP